MQGTLKRKIQVENMFFFLGDFEGFEQFFFDRQTKKGLSDSLSSRSE